MNAPTNHKPQLTPTMSAPSPVPAVQPHTFLNDGDEVMILRRVGKNRTSHGGFVYPSGLGVIAEAPDWNNTSQCGGGLHGWPWGFGIGDGSDFDANSDIWMIFGVKPTDDEGKPQIVGELGGNMKCKFRRGTLRFEGSFKDALDFLRPGFAACIKAMSRVIVTTESAAGAEVANSATNAQSGYSAKNAQSGDSATNAQSGDSATNAQSGDSAKNAQSGYYATNAQSGDSAKNAQSGDSATNAQSGDSATNAQSGDSAKNAQSGYYATNAQSGDSAKNAQSGYSAKNAQSGDSATNAQSGYSAKNAQSGYYATNAQSGDSAKNAQSGDYAKNAQSGDSATNAQSGDSAKSDQSGKDSVSAIANRNGMAKTGERGCFALAFFTDADGWDFAVGKVGRDGIKADTWYKVEAGKLVEVV